jgi:hypothetical protein
MARPVIVVSTGRCGSTLLSNMVREHPELLSLSEFFILLGDDAFPPGLVSGTRFWEILTRPHKRLHRAQRSGIRMDELVYRPGPGARFTTDLGIPPILLTPLPHLVDEPAALFDELAAWVPGLEAAPIAGQYRRLFGWLSRRLGRRVWVERSGVSLPLVPTLSQLFPEAGFVHMYRDGRECAVSMSRRAGFKLMALNARPDLAPPDLMGGGLLNSRAVERMEIPPEVTGKIWSDMIVAGAAQLAETASDRLTSMRYEMLIRDPGAELRRLAAFIGVDPDPDWLRRAGELARPRPVRWTALPEPARHRLTEACAPGMELLYGSEGVERIDLGVGDREQNAD